jgi:hypothetical protein
MEIPLQLEDIDRDLDYPIKDLSLFWTELDSIQDMEETLREA